MTNDVLTFPNAVPVWTFADRLRKVRRDKGLTQDALAASLGIERPRYAGWESGRNAPRDLTDVAEKLEKATGVPRAWFLGWMDNAPDPVTGAEGGQSGRRDSNSQHSAWKAETLAN